jgi:hypothetical protein
MPTIERNARAMQPAFIDQPPASMTAEEFRRPES